MMADESAAGSLWEATAVPAPVLAPLRGETRAQVCVVGAGFTGLSTAPDLAEAGRDVVVVDRFPPGYGASGRHGGQILPGVKWTSWSTGWAPRSAGGSPTSGPHARDRLCDAGEARNELRPAMVAWCRLRDAIG